MSRRAHKLTAPELPTERERGEWWDATTGAKAAMLPSILVLDTEDRWFGPQRRDWQQQAHEAALGLGSFREGQLVWVDGPTGSGKDQLIAGICLSVLHFAPPGFRVTMNSTDFDRAKDVIECAKGFLRRDRDCPEGVASRAGEASRKAVWVGEGITFTRTEIRHADRDIVIECVATDGASASGARSDLFIMNEVQSWADPHGFRVWTETLARFRKKKAGRLVVFSNLPFTGKGDWRRDAWENARAKKGWHYIPVRLKDCPWITKDYIELQRKILPEIVFKRLYLCEPTDGRGELITPERYDAAVRDELAPALGPVQSGARIVGCDLGVSHDHAAVVMLRITADATVVLERLTVWVPSAGQEVPLAEVESQLADYGAQWGARILLDPSQGMLMLQNLIARGVNAEKIDSTPKNLNEQAQAVMDLFRDGRVRLWRDAGKTDLGDGRSTELRQQLLDAELKEQQGGVRIVAKRTRLGHGDIMSAFALAALGVARMGSYSSPAVAKRPPDAPASRLIRRGRPFQNYQRRHGGVFIGPRAERSRTA